MKLIRFILFLTFLSLHLVYGQNHSKTIKIGLLISEDPHKDSISLSAVHAVNLAIQQLDIDVELAVRSCDGPWGITSKQMVGFVYEDQVDAIITSVDGRNAHQAEQVATKTHKSIISSRATDPTLTEAYVPWFFRISLDDRKQAQALKVEIFEKRKLSTITVIHPENYDASYSSDFFMTLLDQKQKDHAKTIIYDPLTSKFSSVLKNLSNQDTEAVVFLGNSKYSSLLIKEISTYYPNLILFGNTALIESGSQLLTYPEGIIFSIPEGWISSEFYTAFKKLYRYEPGLVAAYTYDAFNLAVKTIELSGTEFNQLQQGLQKSDHQGVTGSIRFDEHGNRIGKTRIGYISKGKMIY